MGCDELQTGAWNGLTNHVCANYALAWHLNWKTIVAVLAPVPLCSRSSWHLELGVNLWTWEDRKQKHSKPRFSSYIFNSKPSSEVLNSSQCKTQIAMISELIHCQKAPSVNSLSICIWFSTLTFRDGSKLRNLWKLGAQKMGTKRRPVDGGYHFRVQTIVWVLNYG